MNVSTTPAVSWTLPRFIRKDVFFLRELGGVCTAWRWGWYCCKTGFSLEYHIVFCTYCAFIRSAISFISRTSGFDPSLIHTRFVVDTGATGQDCLHNPLFFYQLFYQCYKIILSHLPSTLRRLEECFQRVCQWRRDFTKREAIFSIE